MLTAYCLLLCNLLQLVYASKKFGEVYLRDGSGIKYPLAHLEVDSPSEVSISDINTSIKEGIYSVCATMEEYADCFAFTEIQIPLSYDLEVIFVEGELTRFSFKPNKSVNGINVVPSGVKRGPEPAVVKLKKTTKTYEAKKQAERKDTGTAAFEEDVVADDRSFIQKNWKYIVIGLLLYIMGRGSTAPPQNEE